MYEYDNNFPNENRENGMSTEQNTDLNVTGGLFSSQAAQNSPVSQTAQNSQTVQNIQTAQNAQTVQNIQTAQNGQTVQNIQTAQNTQTSQNAQGVQANSYYNQAGRDYGYNTGMYQRQNTGQNTGSYQYGNTYPGDYGQNGADKEKKEKTEKTGRNPYFKKALVSVSLGLFFGVCAGLGFYAVEAATGMLDGGKTEAAVSMDVNEQAEAGEEAGEVLAETEQEGENGQSDSMQDADGQTVGSDIKMTLESAPQMAAVQDVSGVVKAVMPSVVSISNTYTETMSYFGQAMTSEAEASGSGIIVGENDSELLIVTNYHVIMDADKLMVQFVEGSEAEASVKGTDAKMDLAIIAVPTENILNSTLEQIAIATLGDSDSLEVGEPAIAIGNSLGYGQSVTTGVISALDRDMELSDGSTGTFIQTDAAINPGNSGGALLNMKGEVIGINSNKIGGSVIEGMGYAIPISAASPIIADLMLRETKNKVAEEERGFLGISGISVTSEVSSTYGMPEGVYIAQVYENTAAEAAGLKKGDIITEFDGIKISSMDELQRQLEYYAKGDTVEITVMTIGSGGYKEKTVDITLGNKVEQ